jgi:hypothetical protein
LIDREGMKELQERDALLACATMLNLEEAVTEANKLRDATVPERSSHK